MDRTFAGYLQRLCERLGIKPYHGGIYIQTIGLGLETKAEINVLKKFCDIIDMTMASEATLLIECGISYVSIYSVDNDCNGIIKMPLNNGQDG